MKYSELAFASMDQPVPDFSKREIKAGADNKAMIYSQGSRVVIAFMYTYGTFSDWWNNFKVWRRKIQTINGSGSAHSGFVYEYNAIRAPLLAAVQAMNPSEIILTGFSQGAAHAVLATRDFICKFPFSKISTKVFACPQVFDERGAMSLEFFSEKCNVKIERITAYKDLVTRSPGWWLGYHHVGQEKIIDGKKWWIFGSMKHHNPFYYQDLAAKLDQKDQPWKK